MFRPLAWLKSLKRRPIRREAPPRLRLERLEDRDVPTTAALGTDGVLRVWGTESADAITVSETGGRLSVSGTDIYIESGWYSYSWPWVYASGISTIQVFAGGGNDTVHLNHVTPITGAVFAGAGNDDVEGGPGENTLQGDEGSDTLRGRGQADLLVGGAGNDFLHGNGGNDFLFGGDDHDILWGSSGTDYLNGSAGNDQLWGQDGWDNLYGEGGNDFLDSGTAWEPVNGGEGYDFNPYYPIINGKTMTDVRQGNSGTCWLMTALAGAAREGQNLASRMQYLGNGLFRVSWLQPDSENQWSQTIRFVGDHLGVDAQLDANQEGEFWTVVYQRALLAGTYQDWWAPKDGGDSKYVLPALTGRTVTATTDAWGSHAAISAALNAGRTVAALTHSGLQQPSLLANHYYLVVGLRSEWQIDSDGEWYWTQVVDLYNPHGSSLTVSWFEFCFGM